MASGYTSTTDILLAAILNLLQGTPMALPAGIKLQSTTDQLLYQIYIALGGGGGGAGFIKADGSVNFNPLAIQTFLSSLGTGTDIKISNGFTVQLRELSANKVTAIQPGFLSTTNTNAQVTLNTSTGQPLIGQSNTGFSHNHIIKGIVAGPVAPDPANYLEVVIDGVTKKVIIST